MAYDYSSSLSGNEFSYYEEKLRTRGLSRLSAYKFPAPSWVYNPLEWPELLYPDLYHYLIATPGKYHNYSCSVFSSLSFAKTTRETRGPP